MVSCSCLYAADKEFPSTSWCIYGLSLLMCVLVAPICMYYCWSRCSICGVEVSGVRYEQLHKASSGFDGFFRYST
jgi:hypothetical protein